MVFKEKNEYPLISVICATYNAEKTLPFFLESIKKQTCKEFELILIDGGSTDRTAEIIKKEKATIDKYLIEPDEGIYDAWNKGLKMSNGHWIGFVGSDDCLHSDFIKIYASVIKKTDASVDYISSNVAYVNSQGTVISILGKKWVWSEFKYNMTTAHVGSMHNAALFKEVGFFNGNYKVVGDYELLLRKRENLKTIFIEEVTADMLLGGMSMTFFSLLERRKAQLDTGGISTITSLFFFVIGILSLMKLKLQLSINPGRFKGVDKKGL